MTQGGPGRPPQQPEQSWQSPHGGLPQQPAYGQGWPPPQHPYAQRPYQPQPPRKRKKWPWVTGAVVLFLAALIGTAINSATPSSRAADSAPATPLVPHRVINSRDWQLIVKDPDAHEGERIIVYGRVTQFDAATGSDTFRASVDSVDHPGNAYAFDTNTVLSGSAPALKDVVIDDLFRAEVTVAGSMSYGTQIGGSTTVPMLTVDTIKVIGRG